MKLHRSITFWSGLLVMVFIVWAWWDSRGNSTYASLRSSAGTRLWAVASSRSAVNFGLTRLRDREHPRWLGFGGGPATSWSREPIDFGALAVYEVGPGDRLFGHRHMEDRAAEWTPSGMRIIRGNFVRDWWHVSYRALLLLHLVVWIALLA